MTIWNIIPKWLGQAPTIASPSPSSQQVVQAIYPGMIYSASSNINQSAASTHMYGGGVSIGRVSSGSISANQAQANILSVPTLPAWVAARNRFATFLHAIEDINGLKFEYDDAVLQMLDLRRFKTNNCQVRLLAFLVFLNCNGVDRHNIRSMVSAAEGMGVEFVP